MTKTHSITANGMTFTARTGEVLLDAALNQGVEFPHDCRAGRCGSCVARVVRGVALGGHASSPGCVYACQARALADLTLEFDDLPPTQSAAAKVTALIARSADVVEVGLQLDGPLDYLPGQYCRFRFRGFPARSFSPTLPADGSGPTASMTLHVKRVRNGRVSMAFGEAIDIGHRVGIEGPFGTAYHRPGDSKRLVLVASGTGYAPILAVAAAALAEDNFREIVLIIGARTTAQFYMADSLIRLLRFPNVALTLTAREIADCHSHVVRLGDPTDYLPMLGGDDRVYACGSPRLVDRIAALAVGAGADIHSDPFEASGSNQPETLLSRLHQVPVVGHILQTAPSVLRRAMQLSP